jgi:hypothetical protein
MEGRHGGRMEGGRDSRRIFRTRLRRLQNARPEGGRGNRVYRKERSRDGGHTVSEKGNQRSERKGGVEGVSSRKERRSEAQALAR